MLDEKGFINEEREDTDSKGRSWKYDILHEVCHQIMGWSCCKEHMEFEVHGATKLLCRLLDIELGDAEKRMNGYAGISSHKSCGRISKEK